MSAKHTSSSQTQNGTTNTSNTGTSITTPNTPDWLAQPWQDYAKTVTGLPGYTVNGPSTLQTDAFNGASALSPSSYFGQGAGMVGQGTAGYTPASMTAGQVGPTANATAGTVQGVSAAPGVSTFLNPYQQYVNSNTINEMDRARQLATTDNGQGAVLSGQFGGSRQGVLDANTNRDFYTTLGNTLSAANAGAYQSAVDAAQQDATRAQAAGTTNAELGTGVSQGNAAAANAAALAQAGLTQGANSSNQTAQNAGQQFNLSSLLSGAGMLGNLGTASGTQQLQQLGLLGDLGGTQYQIGQDQTNAPYTGAGYLSTLLGQIPSNLFVGSTNNVNQNGTNQFSGTGSGSSTTTGGNASFKLGPFSFGGGS